MASLEQVKTLIQSRNLDKGAAALARLVDKKNTADIDWRDAARLANTVGDQELALKALQRWRAGMPGDPQRHVAVINALGAVARHKDAARAARKLKEHAGAGALGYFLEGYYVARLGNSEEALGLYREALSVAPEHTPAWEQIALLGGYDDLPGEIARMEQLTDAVSDPARLVPLYYALGRAHDAAGDYQTAFDRISAGAALRQRLSPFHLQPQLDYYARLQGSFTAERMARLGNPSGGGDAVFILGAPRSGTTLVEQILATADSVTPTGEHLLMRLASLPLASMEPPDMLRADQFDRRRWSQMATSYLVGVRRRFEATGAFTDKSLLNHNYAGLIRLLFPEARLIWLRRDIRDVTWSCFRSRINANRWAQTLPDCIRYLQALDRLCTHWMDVLGGELAVLSYEDLVSSPQEVGDRLFAAAGVDRPDDWQEFHRSANPVATASLAQVRQPLSAASIGSWQKYADQLAPTYAQFGLA